jgi:transcriptional regulator with XRE-family HTH domain
MICHPRITESSWIRISPLFNTMSTSTRKSTDRTGSGRTTRTSAAAAKLVKKPSSRESGSLAARTLGKVKQGSTAIMIRSLRDDYGITQNQMVRLSGYSPRSIASWAKGTSATKPASTKFTELTRLFSALAEMAESPKDVIHWLQEPNEAFDGSTPLQVIERGETDRIWRMIYFLRSGEPL